MDFWWTLIVHHYRIKLVRFFYSETYQSLVLYGVVYGIKQLMEEIFIRMKNFE